MEAVEPLGPKRERLGGLAAAAAVAQASEAMFRVASQAVAALAWAERSLSSKAAA